MVMATRQTQNQKHVELAKDMDLLEPLKVFLQFNKPVQNVEAPVKL